MANSLIQRCSKPIFLDCQRCRTNRRRRSNVDDCANEAYSCELALRQNWSCNAF